MLNDNDQEWLVVIKKSYEFPITTMIYNVELIVVRNCQDTVNGIASKWLTIVLAVIDE